jgi:hypothetical protein
MLAKGSTASRLGAHVGERQHGERRLVGQCERCPGNGSGNGPGVDTGIGTAAGLAVEHDPVGADRLVDVLHLLLAEVFEDEVEVQLVVSGIVGGPG